VTAPGTIDDAIWFVLERKLAVLEQLDYARDAEAGAALTTAQEILAGLLKPNDSREIADEADRWLREARSSAPLTGETTSAISAGEDTGTDEMPT